MITTPRFSFTVLGMAVFLMVLTTSCAVFRKKNKCNTCPNWSKVEKIDQQVKS